MIDDSFDESSAQSHQSLDLQDGELPWEWREALLFHHPQSESEPHHELTNRKLSFHGNDELGPLIASLPLVVLKAWAKLAYRRMIAAFFHWKAASLTSTQPVQANAISTFPKLLAIRNAQDLETLPRTADIFVSERAVDELFGEELSQAIDKLSRSSCKVQSFQAIAQRFQDWKSIVSQERTLSELPQALTLLVTAKHEVIWELFHHYCEPEASPSSHSPEKPKSVGSKLFGMFSHSKPPKPNKSVQSFSGLSLNRVPDPVTPSAVGDPRSAYNAHLLPFDQLWRLLGDCHIAPVHISREKLDLLLHDGSGSVGSANESTAKKKKKKFKISKMLRKGSKMFSSQEKLVSSSSLSFMNFLQTLWEIIFDKLDAEASPQNVRAVKDMLFHNPQRDWSSMLKRINDGDWKVLMTQK